MTAKVETLFEDSKENIWENSKLPSQQRFEDKQKHEIAILVNIIRNAFDDMRDQVNEIPLGYKNHLSKANRMNEQIKGKLTDHYGELVKPLSYNRFGLFLNGYVLLFKKFTNKGLPSNVRTKNSVMLSTKGKLNFPGEPEIIFVGFTVSPGYELLRSIKAVKIIDEEIQWSINLQSLATDFNRSKPITLSQTNDGLVVKPKIQQQKKTG